MATKAAASNMTRKEVADTLKAEVSRYFRKKKRAVFFELGLCRKGRLRADVLALAMNGHVVVVEVKSCKADFDNDTKYMQYLNYANQVYFAFNPATMRRVDLTSIDKSIGIMCVGKSVKRGRTELKVKVTRPARNRELDEAIKFNLAMRAAFRNADVRRGTRIARPNV
jgi:hypothetical protein